MSEEGDFKDYRHKDNNGPMVCRDMIPRISHGKGLPIKKVRQSRELSMGKRLYK
jgi:hypothetical protein